MRRRVNLYKLGVQTETDCAVLPLPTQFPLRMNNQPGKEANILTSQSQNDQIYRNLQNRGDKSSWQDKQMYFIISESTVSKYGAYYLGSFGPEFSVHM